ncbi:TonB-dependent receptor plug domain-containing protein [Actibacterium sp. D379-3]
MTAQRFAAAALAVTVAHSAQAQTYEGEVLGTIVLGESKRSVQTDTAASETVINEEELQDRQANTIAELVDSVPGVSLVNGSTPAGSGINIRGFGANGTYGTDQKVLIQVDGASKGSEELYRIGTQLFTDPELYKEVRVIRGTVGSFAYGSGAVGGVVILKTKDGSDFTGGTPGFAVRQALSYTSNGEGFDSSTILAWQPTEKLEFLVNYVYRDMGVQQDGNGDDIGEDGFSLPSGLLKGKYTFGNDDQHSITAALSYTETDEKDVPYDTFATTGGAFGNVDRYTQDTTATLEYAYNPAGNDLIDLTATLSYSDQKIDSEGVSGQTGGLADIVNADHQYETTKLNVTNDAFFTTGALRHNLKAGGELIHKKRLDASSAPGGTDKRFALFAIDEIGYGGLTVTPAVRYETQRVGGPSYDYYNNDALMGGVSARYEWDSGLSVFTSAAYTENLPIMDDLTNPDYMKQSEKAQTYELGLGYANNSLLAEDDNLAAKATIYRTRAWDLTSYSGVNKVYIEGLEVELSYAMDSGYYADLNGTMMRGEDRTVTPNEDWEGIPADNVRLTLGKRFYDNKLDLNWEVVHNAEMTRSTDPTPSSTVHNLGVSYRPDSGAFNGVEARFAVENLFDKAYQPHLYTRKAPGRTFKLTLAKTF